MVLRRHRFSQNSNEIIQDFCPIVKDYIFNRADILTMITLLFWEKRCLHKIISVNTDPWIIKVEWIRHFRFWVLSQNLTVRFREIVLICKKQLSLPSKVNCWAAFLVETKVFLMPLCFETLCQKTNKLIKIKVTFLFWAVFLET